MLPTRITDGSGTSAQILGLLASIKLTADDELTLLEDATKLLEDFELEKTIEDAGDETAIDVVDERVEDTEDIGAEERAEDTGVTLPQGAPLITGISGFAEPLVP